MTYQNGAYRFRPKYRRFEGKNVVLCDAKARSWRAVPSSRSWANRMGSPSGAAQVTNAGATTRRRSRPSAREAMTSWVTRLRFGSGTRAVAPTKDDQATRMFSSRDVEAALGSEADDHERPRGIFVARKKPRSFLLGTLFTTLFFAIVLLLCVASGGLGVAGGIVRAYTQTTPPLDVKMLEDIEQSSVLYDASGNEITKVIRSSYSEWAPFEEIPDMLKNAFIAVEDVRFYDHNGIDIKRLAGAVVGTLTGDYDGGGSTITQQLIKIQVLGSEQSYRRKVQEAYLAMELEKEYDKDSILEYYLNSIHLGESNYGVKAAASDYFGKSLDQLSIRECAMLAGLTQNPSRYNPRRNMYFREADSMKVTEDRTDTVLERMYTAGFITLAQRDEARAERGKAIVLQYSQIKQMPDMPYFVEYAIYDVVTHFLRQKNLQDNVQNRAAMEKELRTGGYHIYTTVDPLIQRTVQQNITDWDKYPGLRDPSYAVKREVLNDGSFFDMPEPQAACAVMETHTGYVKALIGGRTEPPQAKLWNRAYRSRTEVGSSIKPLSIYGPALDNGASPASIYLNYAVPIEGYGGDPGYPRGAMGKEGPVTMRYGIQQSLNVVAARALFESVGVDTSLQYLQNLGIDPSKLNGDGPGLALGTSGITPLEMTAAYAAIANQGLYLEPIAFTKVTDKHGNIVLDASEVQIKRQVFSPSTAWLLTDMLENAVREGTGKPAQIQNMHVAGKTGTNADYRSVYFAGYTPYYVSALWIGHDDHKEATKLKAGASGGTFAAPLWQAYMSAIHIGMPDKPIISDSPARYGLVQREVCTVSGLLATDACHSDYEHKPVTDWFLLKNVPTERCDMHRTRSVCRISGKLATEYCPSSSVRRGSYIVIPDGSPYSEIPTGKLHLGAVGRGGGSYCRIHGPYGTSVPDESSSGGTSTPDIGSAQNAISDARNVLSSGAYMTRDQRSEIESLISGIQRLIDNGSDAGALASQVSRLRSLVANVRSQGYSEPPRNDPPPDQTVPLEPVEPIDLMQETQPVINEYGEVVEP